MIKPGHVCIISLLITLPGCFTYQTKIKYIGQYTTMEIPIPDNIGPPFDTKLARWFNDNYKNGFLVVLIASDRDLAHYLEKNDLGNFCFKLKVPEAEDEFLSGPVLPAAMASNKAGGFRYEAYIPRIDMNHYQAIKSPGFSPEYTVGLEEKGAELSLFSSTMLDIHKTNAIPIDYQILGLDQINLEKMSPGSDEPDN